MLRQDLDMLSLTAQQPTLQQLNASTLQQSNASTIQTSTGSATTTSSATIIRLTCLPTGRFVSIRVIRIKNTLNDSTI